MFNLNGKKLQEAYEDKLKREGNEQMKDCLDEAMKEIEKEDKNNGW